MATSQLYTTGGPGFYAGSLPSIVAGSGHLDDNSDATSVTVRAITTNDAGVYVYTTPIYRYVIDGSDLPVERPNNPQLRVSLRAQLELNDPTVFEHTGLTVELYFNEAGGGLLAALQGGILDVTSTRQSYTVCDMIIPDNPPSILQLDRFDDWWGRLRDNELELWVAHRSLIGNGYTYMTDPPGRATEVTVFEAVMTLTANDSQIDSTRVRPYVQRKARR